MGRNGLPATHPTGDGRVLEFRSCPVGGHLGERVIARPFYSNVADPCSSPVRPRVTPAEHARRGGGRTDFLAVLPRQFGLLPMVSAADYARDLANFVVSPPKPGSYRTHDGTQSLHENHHEVTRVPIPRKAFTTAGKEDARRC